MQDGHDVDKWGITFEELEELQRNLEKHVHSYDLTWTIKDVMEKYIAETTKDKDKGYAMFIHGSVSAQIKTLVSYKESMLFSEFVDCIRNAEKNPADLGAMFIPFLSYHLHTERSASFEVVKKVGVPTVSTYCESCLASVPSPVVLCLYALW